MKLYKNDIFKTSETFFSLTCGTGLYQLKHSHDYFEIFTVTKGAITHQVNGVTEIVRHQESVFVCKQDNHMLSGDENSEVLNIAFSDSLFLRIQALFDARLLTRKVQLEQNDIDYMLRNIRQLTASPDAKFAEIILKSLLVNLIGVFIHTSPNYSNNYPMWFQDFLNKLTNVDIFTSDINSIQALTDKSPEHLSRTFRQYRNTTLTHYLLDLKLNYAMRLLITTTHPILDICFEAGFANLGYFYRCFKSKYGIPPQKYRKLYSVTSLL